MIAKPRLLRTIWSAPGDGVPVGKLMGLRAQRLGDTAEEGGGGRMTAVMITEIAHRLPINTVELDISVMKLLGDIMAELDEVDMYGPEDRPIAIAERLTPYWDHDVWQLYVSLELYDWTEGPAWNRSDYTPTDLVRDTVYCAIVTTTKNIQRWLAGA